MLYPLSYEGLGRDPSRSNCGYWRGGRVRGPVGRTLRGVYRAGA